MNSDPDGQNARDLQVFPGVGTFQCDVQTGECVCSTGLEVLFGATEQPTRIEDIRAALQAEDRATFDGQIHDAQTTGAAAEHIYRVTPAKAAPRWLNIRAVGAQGGHQIEALVCDVTRSHQSEAVGGATGEAHVPSGQVGVYTHDIAEGLSWWSSGMFHIFDLPHAPAIAPFEEAAKHIHPDDRAHVTTGTQAAMRSLGTFEITYRVRRSDGSERIVLDSGEAVGPLDAATGLAREIRGSVVDITAHRAVEARAAQVQRAYDDLTEQMPFGLYLVDVDLRITAISQGARPAFAGVEPLIGRDLKEVLGEIWPADFVEDAIARFRQTLATGEAYHSPHATEYRTDWQALAAYHWVVQRIATPEGGWGLVCHFYDLSERVNRQNDLETDQAFKERAIRELQAVIDNAVAFIGFLDPSGILYEANQPALAAGGLTREDVIGRPFWETPWWSFEPASVKKLKAAVGRAQHGEVVRYDADVRMREGVIMTIDFMMSPILDASGQVTRIIASGFDITERKKAEENVRMLMSEVNHRSKNVLMLVQSIARMTYRTDPDDFMRKLEERLGGLARSYDLLLTQDAAGIRLDDLVRAQLAHFGDIIDTRITVQGPEIRLTNETAQSLGMAFHELATNAGKYGALSNDTGRVAIRWDLTGDDTATPGFSIVWAEKQGPEVLPPERTGFGSTVLGSMVENALEGTVSLEYAPTGLVWRVDSGRDCVEG